MRQRFVFSAHSETINQTLQASLEPSANNNFYYVFNSVGSEPKLGSAWPSFGSSFGEKKLGSARHILQKKLGSARLALSFKKPSHLEKQKIS